MGILCTYGPFPPRLAIRGMSLEFFSGGVNGEAHVLDACDAFGVYASGSNLVTFGLGGGYAATPLAAGHTAQVHCVSIAELAGQPCILSASADKTIRIWTAHEGAWSAWPALTHTEGLLFVRLSSDGRYLAAYDQAGSVVVYAWDGQAFALHQTLAFGPKRVHSLAWSPEGLLAIGTSDRLLRILARDGDAMLSEVLSAAGHTNWITCLDWSPLLEGGARLLASSGPDKTVRLWKLARRAGVLPRPRLVELIPKKTELAVAGERYVFENDAILLGHEGMVNSCRWSRAGRDGMPLGDLRLVSASADHTLIVWAAGAAAWGSVAHIGDISGSGSVGSDRSFGFYSGIHLGQRILAHGSKGSVQFWAAAAGAWQPEPPLTGHYGPVTGLSWDRAGRFLLSASLDQTTRVFAAALGGGAWHEIARPQIHGYDMQCIAALDGDAFLSGGDEKVLRAFRAPEPFAVRLAALTAGLDAGSRSRALERPTFVPALGLSNKASGADGAEDAPVQAEMPLGRPPTESDLCRHTLWPEVDKLYGHGHELYSLAVDASGRLAASASRANLAADAGIRFWARRAGSPAAEWAALPAASSRATP